MTSRLALVRAFPNGIARVGGAIQLLFFVFFALFVPFITSWWIF
jgi:hypothetical protein